MRSEIRVIVSIVAVAFSLLAQPSEKWCASGTTYASTHEENVASLRWSLQALTVLKGQGWDVTHQIQGITNGAVSCLANLYTLRARYVRDCSVERKVYSQQMAANEKFIALLMATTSREDFPATGALLERRLIPVGSVSKTLEKKTIVLDDLIRNTIEQRRNRVELKNQKSHPVPIVADLLLGSRGGVNESEIMPVDLVPINSKLAEETYSALLSFPIKSDWKSKLTELADYYSVPK